jgi:hypothetical protein
MTKMSADMNHDLDCINWLNIVTRMNNSIPTYIIILSFFYLTLSLSLSLPFSNFDLTLKNERKENEKNVYFFLRASIREYERE